MKACELKAALTDVPDDMEVMGKIDWGGNSVELRDLLNLDRVFERTVAVIGNPYGVGYPHLTEAERQKQRHAILDGLADILRVEKWATRRFTSIHGDWRLYDPFGGQSDTCYGVAYDPRIWLELEAEGLIKRQEEDRFGGLNFSLTEEGQKHVEIKRLVV